MVVPHHPEKPMAYALGYLGGYVDLAEVAGAAGVEFYGAQPVGALAFIVPLLRRWGLRELIDELHPTGSPVSHGQIVEILIANRLTDPEALYRIVDWAKAYDTQRWFGVAAAALTDDRIGETLDVVGPDMDGLHAQWSAQVIAGCGVSLRQIYYDLTSLLFYTKEDTPEKDAHAEPPAVRVVRGHSRDHRPELRQVVVGASAAADGLLPLLHQTHDGNTADTPTVLDHLAEMKKQFGKLLGVEEVLVAGDSKLLSVDVMQTLMAPSKPGTAEVRMDFIAPSTRSGHWAKRLAAAVAARGRGEWVAAAYQSVRTQLELEVVQPRRAAPFVAPVYEVWESEAVLKNKKGVRVTVREVFVYDSGKAAQDRGLRERALAAVEQALAKLRPKLGKYKYKTKAAIAEKVKQILNKQPLAKRYLSVSVRRRRGAWEIVVRGQEPALAQAAQEDGIYSLLTSKSAVAMDGNAVLCAFKDETRVERRWAEFKGPLRVRPVFVRTPVRIVALVGIIMMAMVLWAAVERQCRQGEARWKGRTLKPITAQQIWRRFKHFGGQVVQLVDKAGKVLQQYFVLNALSYAQEQVLSWLGLGEADIGAVLVGTG